MIRLGYDVMGSLRKADARCLKLNSTCRAGDVLDFVTNHVCFGG